MSICTTQSPQDNTLSSQWPRLLKMAEVKGATSLSASSIYRLISEGRFPRQVRLSTQSVAWLESEIIDWVNKKIEQRGEAA